LEKANFFFLKAELAERYLPIPDVIGGLFFNLRSSLDCEGGCIHNSAELD
jgi:hypothetical protein